MAMIVASSCAASSLPEATSQRSSARARGTCFESLPRSISHSGCGYEPTSEVGKSILIAWCKGAFATMHRLKVHEKAKVEIGIKRGADLMPAPATRLPKQLRRLTLLCRTDR